MAEHDLIDARDASATVMRRTRRGGDRRAQADDRRGRRDCAAARAGCAERRSGMARAHPARRGFSAPSSGCGRDRVRRQHRLWRCVRGRRADGTRRSVAVATHALSRLRLGQYLDDAQTLAVIAARLNSLAYGFSGVRPVLLERLADLINHRVLPRIPSEGSVGASGDLTPLSYVAAALVGEREVMFDGALRDVRGVWAELGHAPLDARAKRRARADERHRGDDGPRLSRVRARRSSDAACRAADGAVDRGARRPRRAFRRDCCSK